MKNCIAITILLLTLAGCQATQKTETSLEMPKEDNFAFDQNGLPKHQYYMGCGLEFQFQAFENGHLYMVEKYSNVIIMTKSLEENEQYDFSAKDIIEMDDDFKALLKRYGANPYEMKLWFYFVPAS